jgi:hypothetical protein
MWNSTSQKGEAKGKEDEEVEIKIVEDLEIT